MGCSPGNELYDGQCYYFSTDEVFKPDAKAFCWAREESQLLLISDAAKNAFFAQKVAEKGLKSVWLKINDKKDEGTWVVDRTGYSKPTSWADQTFLAFNQIVENTEEYNSCVLDETELWTIKDKFATSQFVCEGSLVELPENKSRERGGLVPVPNPSDNLQCWTCDATSVSECHFQGTLETCQDNEVKCQIFIIFLLLSYQINTCNQKKQLVLQNKYHTAAVKVSSFIAHKALLKAEHIRVRLRHATGLAII